MEGAIIFMLGILALAVWWIFFSFQPKFVNEKQLKAFNWTIVAIWLMFSVAMVIYIYTDLSPMSREKYFWGIAIGGTLAAQIVFFTIGLLLRNFWIFQPPRRPGRGIFD